MSDVEEIELPPDPERVIVGLRDTGYEFNTAVADIVDNSIAANATKVQLFLAADYNGNIRLLIADNGEGMDRQGLINAMQYGSKARPSAASLGKYGLGLKTASTAFCKRLSVISRANGSTPALMATWDLYHVATGQLPARHSRPRRMLSGTTSPWSISVFLTLRTSERQTSPLNSTALLWGPGIRSRRACLSLLRKSRLRPSWQTDVKRPSRCALTFCRGVKSFRYALKRAAGHLHLS